jgi:hypothetical protein
MRVTATSQVSSQFLLDLEGVFHHLGFRVSGPNGNSEADPMTVSSLLFGPSGRL